MAGPREVRLPPTFGRYLSPNRPLNRAFLKLFGQNIRAFRHARPPVRPDHGALTAIENP